RVAQLSVPSELRASLLDQRLKLGAAEVPVGIDEQTRATLKQAISESFVSAFRMVIVTAAALALASASAAFFLIEHKPLSAERAARVERVTKREVVSTD